MKLSLDFEFSSGATLYDLVRDKSQDVPCDDEDAVKAELSGKVKAAMETMSEPDCQFLSLVFDGQDDEEICRTLRIRRKTLEQRKWSAILRLKGQMGLLGEPKDITTIPGFAAFNAAMRKILSLTPEQAADVRMRSRVAWSNQQEPSDGGQT